MEVEEERAQDAHWAQQYPAPRAERDAIRFDARSLFELYRADASLLRPLGALSGTAGDADASNAVRAWPRTAQSRPEAQ